MFQPLRTGEQPQAEATVEGFPFNPCVQGNNRTTPKAVSTSNPCVQGNNRDTYLKAIYSIFQPLRTGEQLKPGPLYITHLPARVKRHASQSTAQPSARRRPHRRRCTTHGPSRLVDFALARRCPAHREQRARARVLTGRRRGGGWGASLPQSLNEVLWAGMVITHEHGRGLVPRDF